MSRRTGLRSTCNKGPNCNEIVDNDELEDEEGEPRNECYSKIVVYPKDENESSQETDDKEKTKPGMKKNKSAICLEVPVKGTVKWGNWKSETQKEYPQSQVVRATMFNNESGERVHC